MLMTSSYLVGACTGRSAGLVPAARAPRAATPPRRRAA
jgi:hypothetical protein